MSFDKMFDLTAGVYFNFYNIGGRAGDVGTRPTGGGGGGGGGARFVQATPHSLLRDEYCAQQLQHIVSFPCSKYL